MVTSLDYYFQQLRQMADRFSKFYHRQHHGWVSGKAIIKYPIVPEMRCYATLWNVYEANCHARILVIWNSCRKYSFSNISIILFIGEKLFTVVALHVQQPRRMTLRHNACVNDQRSHSHWWHQSATIGWQYTSLILVDHGVKVNEAYHRNVMLLQQFLPAIIIYVRSRASSSSLRTVRI